MLDEKNNCFCGFLKGSRGGPMEARVRMALPPRQNEGLGGKSMKNQWFFKVSEGSLGRAREGPGGDP